MTEPKSRAEFFRAYKPHGLRGVFVYLNLGWFRFSVSLAANMRVWR